MWQIRSFFHPPSNNPICFLYRPTASDAFGLPGPLRIDMSFYAEARYDTYEPLYVLDGALIYV